MNPEIPPATPPSQEPIAVVTAIAPVRVADVGGWTDTWFADSGAVCHLGVGPGVTIRAAMLAGPAPLQPVRVIAPDIGVDFRCGPSVEHGWTVPAPGLHSLLEHAIASVCLDHPPRGPVEITINSAVPPGASLGTSASVVVAMIAALSTLLESEPLVSGPRQLSDTDREALAVRAHRAETVAAGRQAGVQDHWAAAFGDAQLIRIDQYPRTTRTGITLPPTFRQVLADQVVTVVLGRHDSSSLHAEVIESLGASSEAAIRTRAVLRTLTDLAHDAAAAMQAGDLVGWASVLTRCTETQARLHPGLVGAGHRRLIETARQSGAIGWKVNGAGGAGGSLSVVFPSTGDTHLFAEHVAAAEPEWSVHRLTPSPGVTVTVVAHDQ